MLWKADQMIDVDTFRVFLHVLAVCGWVGGQLLSRAPDRPPSGSGASHGVASPWPW